MTGISGIIYLYAFFIGISIYSFVNVVIYRVPRRMPWVNDRSKCPTCGKTLKARDLIPIGSYLALGGRCCYCHSKISKRYPCVELMGGILAVAIVAQYGALEILHLWTLAQAVVVFLFFTILTCIAGIDIDTLEIPNELVVGVFLCGLVSIPFFPGISMGERILGIVVVSIPLLAITVAVKGAFGGGDIKLMAATGMFLGWKLNIVAILLAILLGGFYGIYLLIRKKKDKKDHFAFGPFLCVGIGLALYKGQGIMDWYLGLL
ncbi:MAG: prepilin peptidase [Lachnospiraceae bacterium]